MKKTINAKTVEDFLRWREFLLVDKEAFDAVPCPERLGRKKVPDSLNHLTFEQLAKLWSVKTDEDLIYTSCEVVLGLSRRRTSKLPTVPTVGFLNRISAELLRIKGMFDECSVPPTPEETAAGINQLHFGSFGIIDNYAKRMGFTSHDEAAKTPWLVVWQCIRNDAQVALFNRRLSQVMQRSFKKR